MVDPIPSSVKDLWKKWNIRGAVLFSLLLQTTLILIAPLRKRTAKKIIILLIWSSYLLADATAVFAVGLISNIQESTPSGHGPADNPDLLAFWAPFLLVHLGGPDTITAFALEDNELWLRHLLTLIIQAIGTIYVFLQTLPKNKVWIPTLLLFVSGIIKYLERTRSLFLASMDRFRDSMITEPDPGPNYAKLMEEYSSKKDAKLPTRIIIMPEPDKEIKPIPQKKTKLNRLKIVQEAYVFFQTFKGLVVDLIFSFKERDKSRDFFNSLVAEDALTVIEVELNFIYENLFTKVIVVHSFLGKMFRFLSSASIVTALVLFRYHVNDKHAAYNSFDITVSYALLWGAIGLDFFSFLMAVFSDWTVAALKKDGRAYESFLRKTKAEIAEWVSPIFSLFLRSKKPLWVDCETNVKPVVTHTVMATPILRRRWAGYVFGHSLIRYCLRGSPKQIYNFRVQGYLDLIASSIERAAGWTVWLIKEAVARAIRAFIWFFFIDRIFGLLGRKVYALAGYVNLQPYLDKITWENFMDWVGAKDFLDGILYVSKAPLPKELWEFIFDELQKKSLYADDREAAKRIYSARGDWVLQDNDSGQSHDELMRYILERAYDESLLLWHIATELLYQTEDWKTEDAEEQSDSHHGTMPDASAPDGNGNGNGNHPTHKNSSTAVATGHDSNKGTGAAFSFLSIDKLCCCLPKSKGPQSVDGDRTAAPDSSLKGLSKEEADKIYSARIFSKILSDYMLYLLIMQPTLMQAVAGIGKIRFGDTCAEAERFFKRKGLKAGDDVIASEKILAVNTEVEPNAVKGDRSKSVLFNASILAKELQKLKGNKWKVISRVWVELMSYAASHCRPNAHAQQLSKGGELLSIVWLLMAHFGLGDKFQINEGHARAKLIVGQ